MKKSKQQICKFVGCNKQVYASKMKFCGEHERAFQEIKKVGGKYVLGALTFIAVSTLKKK
ncbi:hypothetical protein LB941_11870 [Ligilactobacillus sp. WILCCON 0076]|uniref:Uncharacterized protein n=1 Tax=Ligilactobacillus ubinensis TaxID=2876789 RepID=A0A9X2FLW5_9LACO|nr:hypothetical protein [Ligilactobacillus ubinensis]MCP0888026.1 hypothetical protein [Ligilactobacillus ubinensis]